MFKLNIEGMREMFLFSYFFIYLSYFIVQIIYL